MNTGANLGTYKTGVRHDAVRMADRVIASRCLRRPSRDKALVWPLLREKLGCEPLGFRDPLDLNSSGLDDMLDPRKPRIDRGQRRVADRTALHKLELLGTEPRRGENPDRQRARGHESGEGENWECVFHARPSENEESSSEYTPLRV